MNSKFNQKELSIKIQELRQLKGKSRKEMAFDLKISHRAYSSIENGEVSITIERLYAIADLLEIEIFTLLGFTSQKLFNQVVHQHSGNRGENINHKEITNDTSFIRELLKAKDDMIELLTEQLKSNK